MSDPYVRRADLTPQEVERLRARDRARDRAKPRSVDQIAKRNADRAERSRRQREQDVEAVRATAREAQKRYRDRWRDAAYAAYGGVCSCCGEDDWRFLTIDHVNGLQGEKRVWTGTLYKLLRDLGYPPSYALLCFNCNIGRARNGGVCPHQDVRVALAVTG